MAFVSQSVNRGEIGFEALDAIRLSQGGVLVYQASTDTLWKVYDGGDKFISVDYEEVAKNDPDGLWGEYKYLGKSLQPVDEDPSDFDWGSF